MLTYALVCCAFAPVFGKKIVQSPPIFKSEEVLSLTISDFECRDFSLISNFTVVVDERWK